MQIDSCFDPAAISNRQILPSIPCQVLIEEELGQNPESGEGWTEYNFQAAKCMHCVHDRTSHRMSHNCLSWKTWILSRPLVCPKRPTHSASLNWISPQILYLPFHFNTSKSWTTVDLIMCKILYCNWNWKVILMCN